MELNWKSAGVRLRFQEAIWTMCGKMPSVQMIEEWFDTDEEDLQQFCVQHARASWMTGMGVIEAAYLLVDGAFENANIDEEGNIR